MTLALMTKGHIKKLGLNNVTFVVNIVAEITATQLLEAEITCSS